MKPGKLINLIDHLEVQTDYITLKDIITAINNAQQRQQIIQAGGYIKIRHNDTFHQFNQSSNLTIEQLAIMSLVQDKLVKTDNLLSLLDAIKPC